MATYQPNIADDADVRCDDDSAFDDEGFPLGARSWVPLYGGDCGQCGERC